MNSKPKRENFASDDDFGEAYGDWMAQQRKASSAAAAAAPKTPPLVVIPVNRKLAQIPARLEAERDTWNQNTKARFLRTKEMALAAANKAKGEVKT